MDHVTLGKELLDQLKDVDDVDTIKLIGNRGLRTIYQEESDNEKRTKAVKYIQRKIAKVYPRLESKKPLYFKEEKGKKELKPWRFCFFETFSTKPQNLIKLGLVVGDAESTTVDEPLMEVGKVESTIEEQEEVFKEDGESMTITLNLEGEIWSQTKALVDGSGKSLEDHILKALETYNKTLEGRTSQRDQDLSPISTESLLKDAKYCTHPGRAEELTRRAIQALNRYNSEVATEDSERWYISQSTITRLIGSKAATVKALLAEKYQGQADDFNGKFPSLTPYSNRKKDKETKEAIKIEDTIDLCLLVPDGL